MLTDGIDELDAAQALFAKVGDRSLCVGVIGLGYVGLPLALRFANVGIRVIGFDTDRKKVDALRTGENYLSHVNPDDFLVASTDRMRFACDYKLVSEVDLLIICVPTPLSAHRTPDLSFVISTVEGVLPYLRRGVLVSLESTTYPGTTHEELLPRITSRGWQVGRDFFLVFSPEREDPGNKGHSTQSIPKVIGGTTAKCLELGVAAYSLAIDRMVPVSSTQTAEMTKLLENIQRAVNIGLVNEMKLVSEKMGIDIHEVIRAASTKPFGFTPYFPGPGWGGHCIPIDPFYLTWKAREFGVNTRFIELAGEINTAMPNWVVERLRLALNDRGMAMFGAQVLVLGIAYKPDIGDVRESPAVEIMEILKSQGVIVSYSDPWVPIFPTMRRHVFDLKSEVLTPDRLTCFDAVLLATDHALFDYEVILQFSRLIVDTRGRFSRGTSNVVHA